jgi:hypothetical protein
MAAHQEVTSVFKEMKANLIRVQHSAQQVFSTPQCSENFRTGEWSVKEDSNFGHGNAPRQVGRQNEQVKSMDPDQIAFVEVLNDNFGEFAIDRVVGCPELLLATSTAVNRPLFDIIHATLRKLLILGAFEILAVPILVRFCFRRIDRGDVVHHGPHHAFAKPVVPPEV